MDYENPFSKNEEQDDVYDYNYDPFSKTNESNNLEEQNENEIENENIDDLDIEIKPSFTSQTSDNNSSELNDISNVSNENLKKKALELAQREANIEKREAEINSREDLEIQLKKTKNNFPPFCPFMRFSIFDIKGLFPKITFFMGCAVGLIFSIVLILNLISAICICFLPWLQPSTDSDRIGNTQIAKYLFMSILFVVVGVPAHLFLAIFPLYKSLESLNLINFIFFFISYILPIGFCLFGFVGWYDYGATGLILAIAYQPFFGRGNWYSFGISTFMSAAWIAITFLFLVVDFCVLKVFYDKNYTFKKAKEFASSKIMKNATNLATKAIQKTISGAISGKNNNNQS